jgi:hypothetical protein
MKFFPAWTNKTPKSNGVLTPFQLQLLESFYEFEDSAGFCLTGGTALAEFYIGHRKSFDFDFITDQDGLIIPLAKKLQETLRKEFEAEITREWNTFVEMKFQKNSEIMKFHLAYDTPFRLQPPVKLDKIILNNYLDLIVDKLSAFFGRCEQRDAVDLYFILTQENASFWDIKEFAQEKDPGFDLYFMAQALHKARGFSEDIQDWPLEMIKPFNPKDLKEFFKKLSLEIEKKIISEK